MPDSEQIPLILSWLQGTLSPAEREELNALLEEGAVDKTELREMEQAWRAAGHLDVPEPGEEMSDRFYAMLERKKAASSPAAGHRRGDMLTEIRRSLTPLWLGIAAGFLLLGILIGSGAAPFRDYRGDIDRLNSELAEMRKVMALSLIDNRSATERLKAVNISSRMPRAEPRIIDALFRTLNNDPNVNVRIAAVEALLPHGSDPGVRSRMVAAIASQESPLVQSALADAMLILQEEGSVEALRELLRREEMDEGLREKIQTTIAKLS